MKVLIDAHMLGGQETGNETYIHNLLIGLGQIGTQCAAAVPPDTTLPESLKNSGIDLIRLPSSNNLLRLSYYLPLSCRRYGADLLHVTYISPLFLPCSMVVSVHDISFRRYPRFFSPRDRLLFATLLPLTLRKAKAVLTLSSHAKAEILGKYPWLEDRVFVTPLAPGSLFRPLNDNQLVSTVRQRFGISEKYVLAVGNLQPRKNLIQLIRAFDSIRRTISKCQLVIVGRAQWRSSQIYALVKQLGLEREVIFTGYVSEEDLILLYNTAEVFVYPSLYEGFGLPILEAMACGTPVITSDVASIPEVASDAAILVNPYETEAIAEALLDVLTSPGIATELSAKGLKRAEAFSWRETAENTRNIYENVLART